MATLSGPCGHCGERAALEIVSEYLLRPAANLAERTVWAVFTKCFHCSRPGYAIVTAPPGSNPIRPTQLDRDLTRFGWDLVTREPVPREPEAPAHLPEDVRRAFEQAARAARRDADADLAIMGCRRTLEIALARKGADEGTLATRIRRLADEGHLTRDLADWAHHIRELGNEAAHGPVMGEAAADQARELLEFTRLVLMYLFTLPGMVEEARRRDGDDDETSG